MHIVIFFLVGVAVLGGFFTQAETPPAEMTVEPLPGRPQTIHPTVVPASKIQQDRMVKQNFDYSCGSAALATLLNYYIGEELTEKQVIAGLLKYGDKEAIASRRAFSLLDMKRFVEVLGYKGTGYKATLDDLKSLGRPAIVPVTVFNYRHFVVFKGIAHGHVLVADPYWGNTSYTLAEFESHWYLNSLFMVYPKHDGETLDALRLREEELRFIDEDTLRSTILSGEKPWPGEREWELDKSMPDDSVGQSKRFDSVRVIQAPEPATESP
ncbi:MAG: C39 family peptidase [Desulfobacterales bacterium]|nr:C39 family peptidase [Desulfobacterales bacterium]